MYEYLPEPTDSPLFGPRSRHADIKRSYQGTPPSWFDGWIFPTLHDLYMEMDAPHHDWEEEAFRNAGWLR